MRHRMVGGEAYASYVVDVHRMFNREFALLPDRLLAVTDGDEVRARLVGSWAWEVLDALHHYRDAQSQLLWPTLRDRMSMDDVGVVVVARARDQLTALDRPRGTAQAAALRFQDGGGLDDGQHCGSTMRGMRDPLQRALRTVEHRLGPIIDAHFAPTERATLANAVWRCARGSRQRSLLAAVLEGSTTPDRTLRDAPAMWRWLVGPLVIEPHTRRMAAVREVPAVASPEPHPADDLP